MNKTAHFQLENYEKFEIWFGIWENYYYKNSQAKRYIIVVLESFLASCHFRLPGVWGSFVSVSFHSRPLPFSFASLSFLLFTFSKRKKALSQKCFWENPKGRRQKAKRKRKRKQKWGREKVEKKDKKDEIEARNDSSTTIIYERAKLKKRIKNLSSKWEKIDHFVVFLTQPFKTFSLLMK